MTCSPTLRGPYTVRDARMKKFKVGEHTISYVDTEAGEPIVFVHGTPSSSFEFREVIKLLSKKYRCVAIDHLGFGSSDKPESGDYSLAAHTERLQALIEKLNLGSFHLVVHDFGGVIGLPLLFESPSRIKSLTLINTWAWKLEEVEPQLRRQKWLMTSPMMKFLYLKLNFSALVMVKMAWGKHRPLTKAHHSHYQLAFRTPSERMGTWKFLEALFDSSNPAWDFSSRIKEISPPPVMILWGEADKFISMQNFKKWKSLFPKARTHSFKNVGHFVCDEAPELVAPALMEFVGEVPQS